MKDVKKLGYYFRKYSTSLQTVTYRRFGKFFHDNSNSPSAFIYLCPLCLKNIIGVVDKYLHYDEEFSLDHFPPASVGGKNTVLVCKSCNEQAGLAFDFSLKDWINVQSFNKQKPNSKLPIKLKLEDTKGIYKGNIVIQSDKTMSFDEFIKYPYAQKWFESITKGKSAVQTITFQPPKDENVFKAILKTAYLYSFSIWGYDFAYSETALHLRNVLFKNEKHPLSNWGIFFHMNEIYPPDGLSYIFKPTNLQTFVFNFKILNKETNYECGLSVLIPGAEKKNWETLGLYQSIINHQDTFTSSLIKLPEDTLTSNNLFPYTLTWNNRSTFKIYGEP